MHDAFRLLTFHTFDENKPVKEPEINKETPSNGHGPDLAPKMMKEYIVQMFGINEKGQTASIFVEGYEPFFYAKVGMHWQEAEKIEFKLHLKNSLGPCHGDTITEMKLIKRKKLYGFDGGKRYNFVRIKFKNEMAMKKAKGLWYMEAPPRASANLPEPAAPGPAAPGPGPAYTPRILNPDGFYNTLLYEAQIPPLLRLFHIKEISPSGWIALPHSKILKHLKYTTSCTFEYTIHYKNIIPLPKKEMQVPYKICSFDIEASSSHGDFPLAHKNYKKLAMNIVDQFLDAELNFGEKNNQDQHTCLQNMLFTAFGLNSPVTATVGIEKVYPQHPVNLKLIQDLCTKWIKIQPATFKSNIIDIDLHDETEDEPMAVEIGAAAVVEEDGAGSGAGIWRHFKPKPKPYKKRGTILDLLLDKEIVRDTKILELTRTLTNIFPPLQGDNVTFIGSTFLKNGADKPYLNHCIARDTCSPVAGAVIESYKTEKEVLLAWTKIIQKEDPDIIIGYNIFGFDYQFMFARAQELGCEHSFLQLSRNKREVCLKRDWKTGKEGLEESTLMIASGQYDLKFVKMTGRLQIDLYNYFRRDYQLDQYKLDYVAGHFIGDAVKKIAHYGDTPSTPTNGDTPSTPTNGDTPSTPTAQDNMIGGVSSAVEGVSSAVGVDGVSPLLYTLIHSTNLMGLAEGNFIHFEEEAHSVNAYKNGQKFEVYAVDKINGTFKIKGHERPDLTKKVRWGLAKDDVTPQDIFRMTNEGPNERAIIAKYCIQDCNLVHHLMRKIDVLTGYSEMANLCSVPLDFLVFRGQGIKLTSFIAKKCKEKKILMPVLDKANNDEGYEGAIVLEPKCNLYLDDPVACVDYGSLYPSSMISENISHDSKVGTKEYNLQGKLLCETGDKLYDNLPGYEYVNIEYDTYKWQRKNANPKAAMEKVKVGYKICRFAQYPNNSKAIMPAILEELLLARKATKKQMETESDGFMKNILDKRQLSIKLTANSMYGQTGAKTSSFYEQDCAASTTAIGRKLLTYAKRVIEEAYADELIETSAHGWVKTKAEYVYGDTDSVFFKFNLKEQDGLTPIIGQRALEITIELAQQAGALATMFLKKPHDLEYEKTFWPYCLLSKKRYVGMLYVTDPHKCKRKSMGIVLNRRDNAPIVKDIYGGIIDMLMKEKNVETAIEFFRQCMQNMVAEKYGMDKLVITRALKSDYKNPNQIAHKVLADRMGKRDAGNKPSIGDRIPFVYIENPDKKVLQGERIETPDYILAHKDVKINYSHYITNQIMKPVQQLFALVLEQMKDFKKKKGHSLRTWRKELAALEAEYGADYELRKKKEDDLRHKEVKALLFEDYLRKSTNLKKGYQDISQFFKA